MVLHLLEPQFELSTFIPPEKRKKIELDPARYEEYVGLYEFQGIKDLQILILRNSTKLYAQVTNQPALGIHPESPDHFFYQIVPASLQFIRDSEQKITGLELKQGGQSLKAQRKLPPSPLLPLPDFPPYVPLSAEEYLEYVGTYELFPEVNLEIKQIENKMYAQLSGQPRLEIFSAGSNHFYYQEVIAELQFERDSENQITQVLVHQEGQSYTGKKIK
jgi:hypothetical protein